MNRWALKDGRQSLSHLRQLMNKAGFFPLPFQLVLFSYLTEPALFFFFETQASLVFIQA